jgi:sugar phosphate isomerase/epimerase
MKISVSMYSLASTIKKENWAIADFIHYAKSISLDGVELLDMYWPNNEDVQSEVEKVKQILYETGLNVSAYDVSNNFVKETHEDRMKEVEKVLDGIRIAKQLGAPVVRVFCGDVHDEIAFEVGADWIIESLKMCVETAEQENILLAIENHGLLAGKSTMIEHIIQAVNSPFVKSTFDTGNFLLVHESPTDAFNRLKSDIVHVHFKDFREKEEQESLRGFRSTEGVELIGTVPGDGLVNLDLIIQGLKEIDYDGWLSIEYEGHDDAKLANEEAVNRLRNRLR